MWRTCMQKSSCRKSAYWLAATTVVLALAGCQSGPRPPHPLRAGYRIVVERSDELAGEPVEVDLIGADESLKNDLEGAKIADYFTPGNQTRADALLQGKPFNFTAGQGGAISQELAPKDEIWKRWKTRDARWLIVIAGANDPRRKISSIDLKAYDKQSRKSKSLRIKVLRTRIELPPLR